MILPLILATAQAAAPAAAPSPAEIVSAAPATDWRDIAADDLMVMELAGGRRVTIQLMPPPFSQGWVQNIRTLAAAKWWDSTSINRVQDNYVVQWGDATEKKPLPKGLKPVPEGEYVVPFPGAGSPVIEELFKARQLRNQAERNAAMTAPDRMSSGQPIIRAPGRDHRSDPYSEAQGHYLGWPVALAGPVWPVHCYAMVGVGRNLSPDTGSGAELYTVIGHAPRHLDRNIALVGRVIEGIEHLSSLPRGTGALGFYEKAEQRVTIVSVRIGGADAGRWQYLDTGSQSFARYADARANRRDPFFNVPAGGADICNIPVPIRRKTVTN